MGSARGRTSAGRPAPVATRAVSSANRREPCRASYPMTSGPVGVPFGRARRTRPAAACRTTARFMPLGPARIGPRSPAVPNVSGPAKRSASSAAVSGSAVDDGPQLGLAGRVGVVGQPALRPLAALDVRRTSLIPVMTC